MAEISVQETTNAGLSPAFVSADAAGDTFINAGATVLHVKNGGASSVTVTVDSQKKCDQGFDHNLEVTVAASGDEIIGPFYWKRFNNEQNRVSVSYSDVTSVTVAAIKLGD